MTERELDEREPSEEVLVCSVCGTFNSAGDRYCAECGALLPMPLPMQARPVDGETPAPIVPEAGKPMPDASGTARNTDQENAAWILGARPTAVIVGGLLLILLAAGLMALGQLEDTGTIVMLSICTAPLGLLTLVIGIARYIGGSGKRGE